MKKIKPCCTRFDKALARGDLQFFGDSVWVYGRPLSVDDGDGYFDDMTAELDINFCPFCGTKVETEE